MNMANLHYAKNVMGRTLWMLILFMVVSVQSISAQGAAEVWLKKASSQLQKKGVEIVFRMNEEGVRIGGKLLMHENRYMFDTDEMKIWFDGTTQWTLQIDGDYKELYISNPGIEDQQSINPYMLLENYHDGFTPSDGGEKTINGKLLHEVILTAKNDNQELSHLKVYLKETGELSAMSLVFPDEQEYRVEVRSMRNGLTFPKNTFVYPEKEFPPTEVIDMR